MALHEFTAWGKTPRLFRDCTITEKIDGTNAAVAIKPVPPDYYGDTAGATFAAIDGAQHGVWAQSRNRIITPQADNAGFAAWVWANANDLAAALGPGLHYGEWWGSKIGRKYGFAGGERFFSLFNTDKHADTDAVVGGVPVRSVPVLYRGPFATSWVTTALARLKAYGSVAAPGFDSPEGVCVFHHASRQIFKATLDNQDAGKWEAV